MGKMIRVAFLSAFLMAAGSVASADHVTCARDINNDGKVDLKDKRIIEKAMGSKIGKAPYDERADINGDMEVNVADLAAYRHCK